MILYPLTLLLALCCSPVEKLPDDVEKPDVQEPEGPDGKVSLVQGAGKGKGLDVVFMGEGFTLADHSNGTYASVMETAVEHFFSIRPVKELRDYFNVWTVAVVSSDHSLSGASGLGCIGINPGPDTQGIIDDYALAIDGLQLDSTVFCIVINSDKSGGITTYESYSSEKAYAFIPMISPSRPGSEDFRLGLVHEAVGHGLAKMNDEYTISGYESARPSQKDKNDLVYRHNHGYDLNITYSLDVETCPWRDFLDDERYTVPAIGFYEGTGYFGKGSYRAANQSLMNTTWGKKVEFSAPDRRIIYNTVIKRATGYLPLYEEFVKFDLNQ